MEDLPQPHNQPVVVPELGGHVDLLAVDEAEAVLRHQEKLALVLVESELGVLLFDAISAKL